MLKIHKDRGFLQAQTIHHWKAKFLKNFLTQSDFLQKDYPLNARPWDYHFQTEVVRKFVSSFVPILAIFQRLCNFFPSRLSFWLDGCWVYNREKSLVPVVGLFGPVLRHICFTHCWKTQKSSFVKKNPQFMSLKI